MTMMKAHWILVLLLAAGLPLAAHAEPLPAWEQLTEQQRQHLLAPVRERWNAASPEQRQRMYDRARRWEALSPDQRRQAREGMNRFERMSPQQREQARVLFQQMRAMTPAQRDELRARWKQMSAQQRREWVEQHRTAAPGR